MTTSTGRPLRFGPSGAVRATGERNELFGRVGPAIMDAVQQHVQEQDAARSS